MHVNGVHGESEKFVVYAMDGVYARNAGAIPSHLFGFVQGRTYFAGAEAQEIFLVSHARLRSLAPAIAAFVHPVRQ